MLVVALLTLLGFLQAAPLSAPAPAQTDANRWAEPTRGILAQRCGSCHLPDLPTSSKGALAVFNLAENPWYGRLTGDQYETLLRRTRGTREMTDLDRATVESFVLCARDHSCPSIGR